MTPKIAPEELAKNFAVELYEAEQKRKKYLLSTRAIIISLSVFFVLLLGLIISFLAFQQVILTVIFTIFSSVTLFTLFMLQAYNKNNLRNYMKTKIITPFVSALFPMLDYKMQGSSTTVDIKKANRFKQYQYISPKNGGEDLISGYLNGIWIELSEIKISGTRSYTYTHKGSVYTGYNTNHAFKGILLFMRTHQEKATLEAVFFRTEMQEHLKKLGKFWGSHPQLTIQENGDCIIDINTQKKGFLEFSSKDKMYDMNYTESLYMEIYLMLHSAELLTQELNNN